MQLSTNIKVTLLVCGILFSGLMIYLLPLPSLKDLIEIAKWLTVAVFVLSLLGNVILRVRGDFPDEFVFAAMFFSFIIMTASFLFPSYSENQNKQRECRAQLGDWVYIGENEGYGCRKEYTSCGPDENRPGYTICEQKFKRVDS